MSRRKKINKFKVAIVVFALLVFLLSVTGLGRFTYNAVRDRYLSSKKFYFTSDLLTPNGNATEPHVYENWDGIGIYELDINMFSKNNDLERYDGDLKYSVKLDYNNTNIECSLKYNDFSLATGNEYYREEELVDNRQTIDGSTNENKLVVYVRPKEDKELEIGQEYTIKVTAYTSEPYKKTIEGTFKIIVSDVAFEIEPDQADVPYVVMNVRNSRDYDSNVTINLKNTSLLRLDMTNRAVYEAQNDSDTATKVDTDPNGVVTAITFKMPKETSEDIKFYKTSPTNNKISPKTYEEWKQIFSIEREKNN